MDHILLVQMYENIQEAIATSHQDVLDVWRWGKMGHLLERLLVDLIVRNRRKLHDLSVDSKNGRAERKEPQRTGST